MAKHRYSEEAKRRLIHQQLERCRNPRLARVVERNICTLIELRQQMERNKSASDHLADWITAKAGSMTFVVFHVAWFGAWIVLNTPRLSPIEPFDAFPFSLLTMVVSLEAIFLSAFILITQNRQSEIADRRNDLDLQIDLLAEYEITRILTLVDAIADRLGVEAGQDPELDELKDDVKPDAVLHEMERRQKQSAGAGGSRV